MINIYERRVAKMDDYALFNECIDHLHSFYDDQSQEIVQRTLILLTEAVKRDSMEECREDFATALLILQHL